jgi:Zn-dependent metalloprotease
MFALSSLFYSNVTQAQTMPTLLAEDNAFVRKNTTEIDKTGWFYFKPEALLGAGELFTTYKKHTGLTDDDQLYLVRTKEDPKRQMTHLRYQQYYKNLKVEGAEFDEHLQNCIVTVANGKLIEGLNIETRPNYDEATALQLALDAIKAEVYAWQSPEWEKEIKMDKDDPKATHFPTGELLLGLGDGTQVIKEAYTLCWVFDITAAQPYSSQKVYVDAQTGEVIAKQDLDMHDGPATLINGYGTRTIDTEWRGALHQNHRLKTNNNGYNIHTKSASGGGRSFIGAEFTDNDDTWNGTNQGTTTTAHWATTEAWKYFKDVHNRSGIDNSNGYLKVLNNISTPEPNASFSWISNKISLWNTQSFANVGLLSVNVETLDIIGHEFTHGVVYHTANLKYLNESGALNESFADIFGLMVEKNAKGALTNWTIGEDGNFTLRSLQMPELFGHPNTYKVGNYDLSPNGGDIHKNCGVHNKWFYLIANGGTHNGINIAGMGLEDAAKILYHSIEYNTQMFDNYPNARHNSIMSAISIFGVCSVQTKIVTDAWAACGVGTTWQDCGMTILGSPVYCQGFNISKTYNVSVNSGNISFFTWQYPQQWNISISGVGNSVMTINNVGFYAHYPQVRTITATDNNTGNTATRTITLIDNCGATCVPSTKPLSAVLKTTTPKHLTTYPNPATNSVYVYLENVLDHQYQITLCDMLGSVVHTTSTHTSNTALDITQLPAGLYFVQVTDSDNQEIFNTSKFIKQ